MGALYGFLIYGFIGALRGTPFFRKRLRPLRGSPGRDAEVLPSLSFPAFGCELATLAYLWLVENGGMVVIVVIIVPHSSIPY